MTTNNVADGFSKITKQQRIFPKAKLVGIFVLLAIQVFCITFAIVYKPTPQDVIDYYQVVAEAKADGSVDLQYSFVWTPLDTSEDLTWVEIGMANKNFEFLDTSANITNYNKYIDEDYVSARLYLDRGYTGGETLKFSFRVNQKSLLCKNNDKYFYEFVPSWFNSTPVTEYCFVWKSDITPLSTNANTTKDGHPAWTGEMQCGTYVQMQIFYNAQAFSGAETTRYAEFYEDGVVNELAEDKVFIIVVMAVICLVALISQIYMIDSIVSYHRGRGFLRGYGHHIHIYGRVNPRYTKEAEKHMPKGGRSGGGGGCACACACACAGGGRAGCSQKDTTAFPLKIEQMHDKQ